VNSIFSPHALFVGAPATGLLPFRELIMLSVWPR
jgi:hypothetical protein